jgi:hypothetical protein
MRAMLDSKRALRRHDVFASFARASAIIAVAEARCDEAVESVTQTIRALRVALRDLRALVTSFDDLRRNFASDPRTMIELGSTGRVHLTAVSGEFSTILQQVEGVADQLTLRDALGLSVDAWSALTAPEGSGLLTCLILPEGSEEQAMWRSAWC